MKTIYKDCKKQIAKSKKQLVKCEMQIVKSKKQIAKCEMQIVKCEMQIAKSKKQIAKCEMQIAKCEMQIAKCEIEPNELNDAKIKIIFLFVFCFLSSVPCYGYSIFSSAGLGEPVYTSDAKERGMGGVFKFDTYKDLAFEFSTLTEAIDTDGKATNFDLTLPQFRFSLPLPKSMAINVGLNEVLNLNFDIQDNWQKCAGDSVQHRITGKGSASTGKVSVCKTLTPVSIEVGGFIVFGSAFEEWITDFGTITDTRDVINMKFNGLGGMGTALLDMGKINLTANYFSSSRLTAKTNLPQRLATSLIFAPTEKFRIGAAITRWQWEKPFTPMQRISMGSEYEISKNIYQTTTLRAGFYTGNWYYEIYEFGKVQEQVGSIGIGVALKSMCKMDVAFEMGTRKNNAFSEKIYRLCITLQGRETL